MLLSFVKGTSISICTVLVLKMKIISNLDENHQYRALRHFNPRYVTTHDLSHAAGPMSALYLRERKCVVTEYFLQPIWVVKNL